MTKAPRTVGRPAAVAEPTPPQQAGETQAPWGWVEPSVWTERMLTRLEQSEPTTVWFRLWDKVLEKRNLQAAFWAVWRNRGAPGVDGQTVQQFEAQRETPRLRTEPGRQSTVAQPMVCGAWVV